ncbi:hypothetical protein L2E82_19404 [Cichorium intybus]|uniref:Uncharacterized protein n=1 Tax=Cichorium intybus TaxID=13427 RepID=A0ACB9FB46_CICIN|nr:hypothetical protein L2E82_19404 [Cichorium intybus]
MIVWDSSRTPTPHEGFLVKRKRDKEFIANIRLEMNYLPDKFKLSSLLMEILGIEVDTRSIIIAAIWQYVKARKLQSPVEFVDSLIESQSKDLKFLAGKEAGTTYGDGDDCLRRRGRRSRVKNRRGSKRWNIADRRRRRHRSFACIREA